jgi:hypothetical protein
VLLKPRVKSLPIARRSAALFDVSLIYHPHPGDEQEAEEEPHFIEADGKTRLGSNGRRRWTHSGKCLSLPSETVPLGRSGDARTDIHRFGRRVDLSSWFVTRRPRSRIEPKDLLGNRRTTNMPSSVNSNGRPPPPGGAIRLLRQQSLRDWALPLGHSAAALHDVLAAVRSPLSHGRDRSGSARQRGAESSAWPDTLGARIHSDGQKKTEAIPVDERTIEHRNQPVPLAAKPTT